MKKKGGLITMHFTAPTLLQAAALVTSQRSQISSDLLNHSWLIPWLVAKTSISHKRLYKVDKNHFICGGGDSHGDAQLYST